MIKILITALVAFFWGLATLQAAQPQTLAEFKTIYEQEKKKINEANGIQEVEQQYLKTLSGLEASFKKAGDFPGTKAVMEEKKRFESCRMLPDETPEGNLTAIADAQKAFLSACADVESTRNSRIEKLTRSYVKALRGYTRTLLEQDKMAQAEEVNAEIQNVMKLIKDEEGQPATVTSSDGVEVPAKKLKGSTLKFSKVKGLVACYPFNGNADNAVSDENSGVVHNATLVADRFGKAKSAYYFNGSDAYISLGSPSHVKNNTGSISAWIKCEAIPFNNAVNIVTKGSDATSGGSYGVQFGSWDGTEKKSHAITLINVNSPIWVRSSQGLLKKETWYQFVGVIDGGTSRIYVNGVLQGTTEFSGTISESSLAVWVGGQDRTSFNYFFRGCIDDVGFYNRVLSDLEVKRLYDAQRVP